jgi:hypothetical protein
MKPTQDAWETFTIWKNINTGDEIECKGSELPRPAAYVDTKTDVAFYFDNQNVYRLDGYGVED